MKAFRNMILAMAGQGVSAFGTNLYNFAISIYILKNTGSATSFALSLIISTLPRILLNPIAGTYIDRSNKKMVVVLADAICGFVMIALYFATATQSLSLWMIYIASVLLNICVVFLTNAFNASMYSIVGDKYIVKVNSFNQTVQSFIQIISPIAGGIIYAIVDIRMFILINGISFFLSSFSELFIDFKLFSKLKGALAPTESFIEGLKSGLRYALAQKDILNLAVYIIFINFFMGTFAVIMPYTLINVHQYDSDLVGFIQAAFPIGMLVASIVVGAINLRYTPKRFGRIISLLGLALILFSLPSLSVWPLERLTPYYYMVVFFFVATTVVAINVPFSVKLQTTIEEEYRGRFFGLLHTTSEGIMPLAFIITGLLISHLPTYVILGVSALFLIGISIHILNNKTIMESEKPVEVIKSV